LRAAKGAILLASPNLYGPFPLTETGIEANVRAESPGVYALGFERKSLFIVTYVGRDDADVKRALKTHVAGPYQQFKLAHARSGRDAYLQECELYHDYAGLDNDRHPSPPKGLDLQCERCRPTD
jgi:hypothetical protein